MSFNVFMDGEETSENGNTYYKIRLDEFKTVLFEKGSCDLEGMKQKLNAQINFLPKELEDQLWRIEIYANDGDKKVKIRKSLDEVDEIYKGLQDKRVEYSMRQNCVPGAMDGRSFALERQMFFSAHGQAYGFEHPGTYTPYKNPEDVEHKRAVKKIAEEREYTDMFGCKPYEYSHYLPVNTENKEVSA